MNINLPSLIQDSSLINPKKILQKEINRHTLAIHKVCRSNRAPNILYDRKFWKRRLQTQPSLQGIYDKWQRLESLAHVNSQALLELYQEHLVPLKRLYQYYGAQENSPIQLKKINDNLESLKNLKSKILEGLYFRTKIYQSFEQGSQLEDVYGYFFKKLNIPINNILRGELSHDYRIMIYDLLSERSKLKKVTKDKLYQKILQNLPQQGYAPLTTLKQSVQALEQFNQSRQDVLESLAVAPLSKGHRIRRIEKKQISIKQKLAMLIGALTVSGFIYIAILLTVQPYLMIMLNQTFLHFFNQALFYSVPFAPLYWVGISTTITLIRKLIHQFFSYKTNTLLKALHDLEHSHLFSHQMLSHPVVDLQSFNTKQLIKKYQAIIDSLHDNKIKLSQSNFLQRLFYPSKMIDATRQTRAEIESIQINLKNQLSLLSEHLAMRVGQEIKTLDYNLIDKKLETSLSLKQLKSVAKFVRRFGSEETQKKLQDNTNVVKTCIDKIAEGRFQIQPLCPTSTLHTPWGKYDIAKASLNGWDTIFENYILCESQRKAARSLIHVLSDVSTISVSQWQQCYECLNLNASQIKVIDKFIFDTLNSRRLEHSQLLLSDSQLCLRKWKEENQERINTANAMMRDIFHHSTAKHFQQKLEQYNLDELATFNELYEINRRIEIMTCSANNDSLGAEQYFKNYDGSHSFAHLLINFLAPSQRKPMLHHIAEKRLAWMIDHIEDESLDFDQFDGELFLDLELFEDSTFDFKKQIKDSLAFKQKNNPAMERFLNRCKEHGFVSGRLLLSYKSNNRIINSSTRIPKADDFSVTCLRFQLRQGFVGQASFDKASNTEKSSGKSI